MKKLQFLASIAFLVVALLSVAFSHAQSVDVDNLLTEEEKIWIAENPIIKSTNEPAWAPLDFIRNGEAVGFSIDYLNLVAQKVGLQVEYINGYSWEEMLAMLRRGEIDISQSIILTPEREEYLNFTEPYLDMPMVYFGRKGGERINSIDDLADKRIGIIKGSVPYGIYKANYSHFNLIEFESTIDALKALSAGAIDVNAGILPVSQFMINTNLLPGIEVIGDTFFPETNNSEQIRLAARKDLPMLHSILEKGMAAVSDEEFTEIAIKWQTIQTSAQGLDIGLTVEEREWLMANPVINVGVDPALAPLEFINQNGDIEGIAGSYLDKISQRLNVEFRWAGNETWLEALEAINNKTADLLTVATPTDERREFLIFTDGYINISYVIFAREGGDVFANLDTLNDRRISQVEGFAISDFIARDYPGIEIVYTETAEEAIRLASIGEVDAYVGSMPLATYAITNEGYINMSAVGDTPYRASNAMGIRSDLPLLASAMNKALRAITEAEKAEISRTWLDFRRPEVVDYTLVWQIIGIAGIVVIMIMVRNYSLRKEVARRQVVEKQLIRLQEKAESAQADAEAANIAKSNFLANMSHEIRTPLNAIIGFSDAMLAGVGGVVTEKKHTEYLSDIRDSGEHLATVIKDILDLSKIEAGKWKLQETEFSLDDNISEAIKMLSTQAEAKGLSIDYSPSVEAQAIMINGDAVAVKRMFINLISNAIKFTSPDGRITCSIDRLRNGQVAVKIIDTGVGIPADRLSHVLNPFEQSHEEHDLNEEGTGLGLPIVKNLVELHGGKFTLKSEVGLGTTATINFPSSRIVS